MGFVDGRMTTVVGWGCWFLEWFCEISFEVCWCGDEGWGKVGHAFVVPVDGLLFVNDGRWLLVRY